MEEINNVTPDIKIENLDNEEIKEEEKHELNLESSSS
jgi:hypothetical protein